MKLYHYSSQPVSRIDSTIQREFPNMKPEGFWISIEESWKDWCEGENWGLDRLKFVHEVKLNTEANILWLNSEDSVRAFHRKFNDRNFSSPNISKFLEHHVRITNIHWTEVAKEWKGIFISPYQYGLILSECLWYYSWDCASGCIWDTTAIEQIIQLRTEE